MALDTQQKSAELAARLDRLPFSKWHRNLFVLCFLGVMFDACDFALFGMALPPVAREFGLIPVGLALAAIVALLIIPTWGWRAVFVAGVVPAVLLFFVRIYMPESVRYLITQGRVEEAKRTVAEIEKKAAERRPLPPVPADHAAPDVAAPGVTVAQLLTPARRKRTILLWIVSFCFLWSSSRSSLQHLGHPC